MSARTERTRTAGSAPHARASAFIGPAEYTCPMHPEIVRDAPGSCPICGMALEPRTVSAEEPAESRARRHDAAILGERRSRPRRWSLIAMLEMLPRTALALGRRASVGWSSLLRRRSCCGAGFPFFVRAWQSLVHRSLNMFTLIGLGVSVAYVYSLVATFVPGSFPPSFRGPHGEVPPYFEPAAVIVTLVLLGQVLELRARSQTGAAIRALLGLAPKTARRIRDDGSEEDVPLDAGAPRAIGSACAPARRCPSTASCSKERARSTNRWSRANRFRSKSTRTIASSAARSTAPARS